MGSTVLVLLTGMVRWGKGVGWDFLDGSGNGYLIVELVGLVSEWDWQGLVCTGIQYFLGFVSGSGSVDYKLADLGLGSSNTKLYILNNITHSFTFFHIFLLHIYIKNIQTILFNRLIQAHIYRPLKFQFGQCPLVVGSSVHFELYMC